MTRHEFESTREKNSIDVIYDLQKTRDERRGVRSETVRREGRAGRSYRSHFSNETFRTSKIAFHVITGRHANNN